MTSWLSEKMGYDIAKNLLTTQNVIFGIWTETEGSTLSRYFPKYAFIALMLIYVNFVVDVNYFAMK